MMSEVTAENFIDVSYKGKVCPACLKLSFNKESCAHHHPEDNEVFEIPTVEVSLLVIPPLDDIEPEHE
jgi:hypothetical protein